MIDQNILKQKLKNISRIINEEFESVEDIGVMAGLSGLMLYQFYYTKFIDEDEAADSGILILTKCIEKLNDGYSFPSFCGGIAGFCWTVQHLHSNDFIDIDCDDLLSDFDTYLYQRMKLDLNNQYYDFMHGGIGYGFYFLSRYQNTKDVALKSRYQQYILDSILLLDQISISSEDKTKWESVLNIEKKNRGFNLGLSHGMSSILNYLSRLNEVSDFQPKVNLLMIRCLNYVLDFEKLDSNSLSCYPNFVEENTPLDYNTRIAWCYGDLGIGLSLLRAAKSLKDEALEKRAISVLRKTSYRKSNDKTLVKDAGICHGSYGNSKIYNHLYLQTNDQVFREASLFWLEDGVNRATHKDGYAGYKNWDGFDWKEDLTLLDGIAGIGLTIIDLIVNESVTTWDECLLLS